MPPRLSELERETVDAINRERERKGLARLSVSSTLTRIARTHSAYQAKVGKSGHAGEGGSLPADRANAGGVAWSVLAENVAMNLGHSDPVATAVRGWMKSAAHRKNILGPMFAQTGVGIVTLGTRCLAFGCECPLLSLTVYSTGTQSGISADESRGIRYPTVNRCVVSAPENEQPCGD